MDISYKKLSKNYKKGLIIWVEFFQENSLVSPMQCS